MSRTRISTKIMENNSNQLSLLSGSNACNFNGNINVSFQGLFDKSLDNKKQFNLCDANIFSETNESLLNTLNVIDFNIPNECEAKQESTYTLDDLLDLGNDLNQPEVPLFEDEPLFTPNDILLQTALPSPVSSSSDESCDLDDILFMNESVDTFKQPDSPVFNTNDQYVSNISESKQEDTQSLSEVKVNEIDLSALCSLLFQSKGIVALEPSFSLNEPESPSESLSPASSESESEKSVSNKDEASPRYKPYSKKKQKTPEQKMRKMAQNRTAASRYRVKKKDELKIMTEEADKLDEVNKELKGKVEGLRNEIDYLKNLMLDVIKARLTKGATPDSLLSAAATLLN